MGDIVEGLLVEAHFRLALEAEIIEIVAGTTEHQGVVFVVVGNGLAIFFTLVVHTSASEIIGRRYTRLRVYVDGAVE